jgi:uncharacterized membrane protein YhaH (DUF805 family)
MDWTTLLFGFRGRINRGRYWFALLLYMLAWACFIGLCFVWLGEFDPALLLRTASSTTMIRVAALIVVFFWAWSIVAVGIKRLHDRSRSGWWLLPFWFVPGVLSSGNLLMDEPGSNLTLNLVTQAIGMWGFVELGCLKGADGPNAYGPDPLGPQTQLIIQG